MPRWAVCLIVSLAAYLVGTLLAPKIPAVGDILSIVCVIVAIVALVAGIIFLIMWLVGRLRTRT